MVTGYQLLRIAVDRSGEFLYDSELANMLCIGKPYDPKTFDSDTHPINDVTDRLYKLESKGLIRIIERPAVIIGDKCECCLRMEITEAGKRALTAAGEIIELKRGKTKLKRALGADYDIGLSILQS